MARLPENTSYRKLAAYMGVKSMSTLHNYCERAGILDEVREAFSAHKDVLSREGRQEFAKEAELKFLRGEVKRLQGAVVHQEDFFDRIVAESKESRPAPKFSINRSKGKKERGVVLHLSDMHYGQEVLPEDTPGGLNVYNEEVFKQRLARYTDAVTNSLLDLSRAHGIENVVFALGGDMCEGYGIYKGQEWHLWTDPVRQVVEVADYIEHLLAHILDVAFEECGVRSASVVAVNGNHGTPQGRKAGAQPTTHNYDWLIYKMLEKGLSSYPLEAFGIEPGGACYFQSQGHIFYMTHGHTVKGWGGIPYYGLTRSDARTIRMNNTIYDYGLFAHHHQNAAIPIGHGEMFINGNWVGANNLAQYVGSGPAAQNCYVVSREYGVGERWKIELQTKEERVVRPEIHATGA